MGTFGGKAPIVGELLLSYLPIKIISIQVSFWMKRYENFVGLTDVKASQARVVECEKRFIEMQEKRREAQINIAEVQKRIKVNYSENSY